MNDQEASTDNPPGDGAGSTNTKKSRQPLDKKKVAIVITIIFFIALAELFLFVYGQFTDLDIGDQPGLSINKQEQTNDTGQPPGIVVEYVTLEIDFNLVNYGRIDAEDFTIRTWLENVNATGISTTILPEEDPLKESLEVLEEKSIYLTFKNVPIEYDNVIDLNIQIIEDGKVTEKANSTIKKNMKFGIEPDIELTKEDLLERNYSVFLIAVGFEGILVLATVILGIVIIKDKDLALAVSALGLAPLFRIVNVATPLALDFLVFVTMSYGFLLVAVFLFIYIHKIKWNELGVTFKKIHIFIPVAVFLGFLIAPIEYFILGSPAWIPEPTVYNLLVLSLVMIFFVGMAEELMFRAIIQTKLEKITSPYIGLFLTAVLFGIMHGVWTSYLELIFTFSAGLIFGYLFMRMRNLPFITVLHGAEDIFLFGLLPFLL